MTFRCGDREDLERKLVSLIAEPERVRELASTGRERTERCYSWDSVVDRLERVYDECAGASAA